jgi:exosortase/archaeosortase family protein
MGLRGWKRALLGACAAPIAILVNALRVGAVALMCRFNYPLAVGAFHEASGWAALALALVLLAGAERAIRLLPAGVAKREPRPVPSMPVRPVWLVGVALVLLAQFVPVFAAPLLESPPRLRPLSEFPENLGGWRMTRSATVPADELAALNADDFLGRFYVEPAGGSGEIELRLAYHRSQRVHGRLPHSPRVCLPANGWTPIESRVVKVPGGEVNLYVVRARGGPVLVSNALAGHCYRVANAGVGRGERHSAPALGCRAGAPGGARGGRSQKRAGSGPPLGAAGHVGDEGAPALKPSSAWSRANSCGRATLAGSSE